MLWSVGYALYDGYMESGALNSRIFAGIDMFINWSTLDCLNTGRAYMYIFSGLMEFTASGYTYVDTVDPGSSLSTGL